jgi:hypothetical protein
MSNKTKEKNVFVCILSATDEKWRIWSRIRIRIRKSVVRTSGSVTPVLRIHLFLGLPDPLVRDSDPDPDPSIIKQKY